MKLMDESKCPKCGSTNIETTDELDIGAFLVIHIPIWGADWKCNDCKHKWNNKMLGF